MSPGAPQKEPDRLRLVSPAVPYLAMLLGIHLLSSGWASLLLYHAGIVAVLATARWAPSVRMSPTPVCVRLLPAAGVFVLVGPAVYLLWTSVRVEAGDLSVILSDLGLSGAPWVLFAVYYATVNPIMEEVFWRGYLGSPHLRPVAADLWFAGYHILVLVQFVGAPWVAAGFVALAAGAWLWRQMARACDGLVVPIVTHAVADAGLIVAAALLAG